MVGVFLSWRYQAIACAIIPVAFHIIMYFVPESPRYLVQKDKEHKAEKAIYWLKGSAIDPEFVKNEIGDVCILFKMISFLKLYQNLILRIYTFLNCS